MGRGSQEGRLEMREGGTAGGSWRRKVEGEAGREKRGRKEEESNTN